MLYRHCVVLVGGKQIEGQTGFFTILFVTVQLGFTGLKSYSCESALWLRPH